MRLFYSFKSIQMVVKMCQITFFLVFKRYHNELKEKNILNYFWFQPLSDVRLLNMKVVFTDKIL